MTNSRRVSLFGGGAAVLILVVAAGISLSGESPDTNAEAFADLAQTRLYKEWDWAGAEHAFQQALRLDPKLARAHAHYAWYLQLMGHVDEALAEMRRACELEPQAPLWPAWLAYVQCGEGQYDGAIKSARRSLELKPGFPDGLYILGLAYAAPGRYEEAIEAHAEAGKLDSGWKWGLGHTYALAGRKDEARSVAAELEVEAKRWDTVGIAEIYTALGEKDKAFKWLETAFEKRHPFAPWIRVNPSYEPLREDPRFQDLLQRMNLPPLPPRGQGKGL